jgi:hypothetical protein
MRGESRVTEVGSGAQNFRVVLDQHAVVQHRHRARPEQFSLFIKSRRVENNIVSLPLARFALNQKLPSLIAISFATDNSGLRDAASSKRTSRLMKSRTRVGS